MVIVKTEASFLKKAIQYSIHNSPQIFHQLRFIALWVLIGFAQIAIFNFSFGDFNFSKLLDPFCLLGIVFFFILFVEMTFIFVNISALAFWITARGLKGQGTLFQTSLSFLKVLIHTTAPFGCFFILPRSGPLESFFVGISSLGMLGSLIYGFVIMITSFSKLHHFSENRAFLTFCLGLVILSPIVFLINALITAHGGLHNALHAIYVVTVPISVQLIATFSFIFVAYKIGKKCKKPNTLFE